MGSKDRYGTVTAGAPEAFAEGGVILAGHAGAAREARWRAVAHAARASGDGVLAVEPVAGAAERAAAAAWAGGCGLRVLAASPGEGGDEMRTAPLDGGAPVEDLGEGLQQGGRYCVLVEACSPASGGVEAALFGVLWAAVRAGTTGVFVSVVDPGSWRPAAAAGATGGETARGEGYAASLAREGRRWGVRLLVSAAPDCIDGLLLANARAVVAVA